MRLQTPTTLPETCEDALETTSIKAPPSPRDLRGPWSAQSPARPPEEPGSAGGAEVLPGESSLCLGHQEWGPSPLDQPHAATRRGIKAPAALTGPKTPVARPHSPVLSPHDLVLVRDELVYIFQIKLVRHGAAALWPAAAELP